VRVEERRRVDGDGEGGGPDVVDGEADSGGDADRDGIDREGRAA
jgi:hypothetical protein